MTLGNASSITPSDMLGLTRFLTDTLDNTSAFSDTNIKALLNIAYRGVQAKLLSALNYDWKENTVDGAGSGLINLTASDNSYAFPTDMIQVDRIEISYTGNTNSYVLARIVPLQSIDSAISNTTNNSAIIGTQASPVVYIRNNVFYVDPIPDQAVTSGMKVWGQTLITDLSDAAHEPVFAESFHRILPYEAAEVWSDINKSQRHSQTLRQKKMEIFEEMVSFYSVRNATAQPVLRPVYRSMK